MEQRRIRLPLIQIKHIHLSMCFMLLLLLIHAQFKVNSDINQNQQIDRWWGLAFLNWLGLVFVLLAVLLFDCLQINMMCNQVISNIAGSVCYVFFTGLWEKISILPHDPNFCAQQHHQWKPQWGQINSCNWTQVYSWCRGPTIVENGNSVLKITTSTNYNTTWDNCV